MSVASQTQTAVSNGSSKVETLTAVGAAPSTSTDGETHYGDWPNAAGFNASIETRTPVELKVTGNFPEYAAGTLYRTGPGHWQIPDGVKGGFNVSHWFDGFTHIHRFQMIAENNAEGKASTRVIYNSRSQVDGLIEHARKTGKMQGISFGQKRDPCETLYAKLKTTFEPTNSREKDCVNTGVTVSLDMPGLKPANAGKSMLVSTTDSNSYKLSDPKTLEPLELTSQAALHPSLKGAMTGAHAQVDPATGDVYNFNLSFGPVCTYRIYRTTASTGKTEILATFPGDPAYIHSIFMSEDFLILCIWSARFTGSGAKILWTRNILDNVAQTDKAGKNKWVVVDRKHGRGRVAEFESPGSFCFHSINAWQTEEKDGKVDIICDLSEFDNMDILHKFYYENLVSNGPGVANFMKTKGASCAPHITRYRLGGIPTSKDSKRINSTAQRVFRLEPAKGGDLPVINSQYSTKPHRYVYTVMDTGKASFIDGLCKTDVETRTAMRWKTDKHTPGEPIFVARPNGDSEDDGIILSVVLDGTKGTSYLLCLDAKTMTELGRADCEKAVGFGFHGKHYVA